jgi:uncharacterized small protein (DUF1192 family)
MCDRTLAGGTVNAKEVAMDTDDLAPRKKPPQIQLGEDIAALSAHELEMRIALLEEEIARCKKAIAARHATKSAAENFFKR